MGDAHPIEVDTLDILKSKITKAVKASGISSEVAEITIIEPPELKGEHFATETVYAKIRFNDSSIKEKNLFVKKFGSNSLHTEMVKKMKVMEKEAGFFIEFLPLARNFCKRFPGCENLLDFFPKCFHGDDECVILENLVLDNDYIMLDKGERQDFNTAKLVVTNLAKFHAANFALIEEMGREEFRMKFALQITEGFDFSETSMMGPMFDNGISTCMKILEANPVPGSKETIEKLGALLGKMVPELRGLLTSNDAQPLIMLNHGDCWNNNMLFKRNPKTGQVSDHILVDLQITRYGSPCLDLGHYFFTSIKPEVRRAHYKDLLKIYYDQFVKTSELLESKCPLPFEELLVDFKQCAKLGYILSLSMQTALEAFKDVDPSSMGTNPEEMMEAVNRIIANWIEKSPEKANQIAHDLVLVVQEFENLQRK